MPDRILRAGIISSEKINKLSWASEVFYRRLMSVSDDYGRYEFNPKLLRSQLYPLKVDRVSVPDIVKWATECVAAGLIRLYTVANKEYFEIIDFNQRLRSMKSKYPEPLTENLTKCGHPHDNDVRPHDNVFGNESETETETIYPSFSFDEFWDMYDYKKEKPKVQRAFEKLKPEDREKIKQVLPDYVKSTPEKKFRKYPIRWIQNRCWEDEVKPESTTVKRIGTLRKALKIWPNCIVDCEGGFNYEAKLADVQMFNNGKLDLSHFDREF